MYKGIVFDDVQRNAFLSMAAQERLICEKGMTDGVFEAVTRHIPSSWFARVILEQFTVAATVYVDPYIYSCIDGELIEKGIIMPYKKSADNVEGLFTFDVDTVQQMMAKKGFDIQYYTVDRIREIFDEWKEKVEEFLKFESQYNLDYDRVRFLNLLHLEPKEDYGSVDVNHFIELGDFIYHNPVFEVLKEYRKLFNIAYHNELLSPVINVTNLDIAESPQGGTKIPVIEGAKAVKILKYTSQKLDRIYTASSLRDSVKLVQTDEAKAYRNKVDEWISTFSEQNYDNMQMIEDEITKVQKAMRYKKIIETTGKVCATAGVGSTLISPIYPHVFPIGVIATFASLPAAFWDPTKKHLWASFGIYGR